MISGPLQKLTVSLSISRMILMVVELKSATIVSASSAVLISYSFAAKFLFKGIGRGLNRHSWQRL